MPKKKVLAWTPRVIKSKSKENAVKDLGEDVTLFRTVPVELSIIRRSPFRTRNYGPGDLVTWDPRVVSCPEVGSTLAQNKRLYGDGPFPIRKIHPADDFHNEVVEIEVNGEKGPEIRIFGSAWFRKHK